MGPGRREIGHGALAERSARSRPAHAGSLPLRHPPGVRCVGVQWQFVHGISVLRHCSGPARRRRADRAACRGYFHRRWFPRAAAPSFITDILGEEDHYGDMDFKVSGTTEGITGIQLDLKARGISYEHIAETFVRTKEARLQILQYMSTVMAAPRPQISQYAPRLLTIKVNPEKIGKIIGPGGKMIKSIVERTGAKIDIQDDGTVFIAAVGMEAAEKAREEIERLSEEVKIGKIYNGKVTSIKDFGAFIEVIPGQDGLCHISELSDGYLKTVADAVKIGQAVRVKVIAVDDQGRIKLSRKQAMRDEGVSAPGGAPRGGPGGRTNAPPMQRQPHETAPQSSAAPAPSAHEPPPIPPTTPEAPQG